MSDKDHYVVEVKISKVEFPVVNETGPNGRDIKVQLGREVTEVTKIIQVKRTLGRAIAIAQGYLELLDADGSETDE